MAYNFVITVTYYSFVGRYEIYTSESMRVAAQRVTMHQITTTSIIDHHICHYFFYIHFIFQLMLVLI